MWVKTSSLGWAPTHYASAARGTRSHAVITDNPVRDRHEIRYTTLLVFLTAFFVASSVADPLGMLLPRASKTVKNPVQSCITYFVPDPYVAISTWYFTPRHSTTFDLAL